MFLFRFLSSVCTSRHSLSESGTGMPIPKRSTKWMTKNRAGIILSMLIWVFLINIGYAFTIYSVEKPTIQWKQGGFRTWDVIVKEYAKKDRLIISGTFFDVCTGKIAYAKYTRNLNGFLGVTLIYGGDIYYHPRQQGYKTLDLNGWVERVAVGFKPDGTLIIGEGTCPLVMMAYYMKAAGCVEAVGLDGGSSVGIWKNKTIIKPGRSLTNVYCIDAK